MKLDDRIRLIGAALLSTTVLCPVTGMPGCMAT